MKSTGAGCKTYGRKNGRQQVNSISVYNDSSNSSVNEGRSSTRSSPVPRSETPLSISSTSSAGGTASAAHGKDQNSRQTSRQKRIGDENKRPSASSSNGGICNDGGNHHSTSPPPEVFKKRLASRRQNKSLKENDMQQIVSEGHPDDREYLTRRIERYRNNGENATMPLHVFIERRDVSSDRLRRWLLSMNFEDTNEVQERLVYRNAGNVTWTDLLRMLQRSLGGISGRQSRTNSQSSMSSVTGSEFSDFRQRTYSEFTAPATHEGTITDSFSPKHQQAPVHAMHSADERILERRRSRSFSVFSEDTTCCEHHIDNGPNQQESKRLKRPDDCTLSISIPNFGRGGIDDEDSTADFPTQSSRSSQPSPYPGSTGPTPRGSGRFTRGAPSPSEALARDLRGVHITHDDVEDAPNRARCFSETIMEGAAEEDGGDDDSCAEVWSAYVKPIVNSVAMSTSSADHVDEEVIPQPEDQDPNRDGMLPGIAYGSNDNSTVVDSTQDGELPTQTSDIDEVHIESAADVDSAHNHMTPSPCKRPRPSNFHAVPSRPFGSSNPASILESISHDTPPPAFAMNQGIRGSDGIFGAFGNRNFPPSGPSSFAPNPGIRRADTLPVLPGGSNPWGGDVVVGVVQMQPNHEIVSAENSMINHDHQQQVPANNFPGGEILMNSVVFNAQTPQQPKINPIDYIYPWENTACIDLLYEKKLVAKLDDLIARHGSSVADNESHCVDERPNIRRSPPRSSGPAINRRRNAKRNSSHESPFQIVGRRSSISIHEIGSAVPMRRSHSADFSAPRNSSDSNALMANYNFVSATPFHQDHSFSRSDFSGGSSRDDLNHMHAELLNRYAIDADGHEDSLVHSAVRRPNSSLGLPRSHSLAIIGADGIMTSQPQSRNKDEIKRRKLLQARAKQRRMSTAVLVKKDIAVDKRKTFFSNNNTKQCGIMKCDSGDSNHVPPKEIDFDGEDVPTMFSPSAKSKYSRKSFRRSSMAFKINPGSRFINTPLLEDSEIKDISMMSLHSHDQPCAMELSMDQSIIATENSIHETSNMDFDHDLPLNEMNFAAMIFGGTYQNCFDNDTPVVAVSQPSAQRVIAVSVGDDNMLTLRLYAPRQENSFKEINLGTKWKCYRCSPTGYLVAREAMQPYSRTVCYFLSKHPSEWTEGDGNYDMQKNEKVREESILNLSGENKTQVHEDLSPLNCALLALVIDFLIVDPMIKRDTKVRTNALFRANTEGGNGINARITRSRAPLFTNASASSQEWNAESIACVCKTWALAVSMVIARRRGETVANAGSRNGLRRFPTLNYDCYMSFLSKFPRGKFLSEGACKNVYRVSSGDSERIPSHYEAISIMDIKELKDRDMLPCVAQELQISLLASKMVSLRICPFLVQVYSLFACDYDAPSKTLWNDSWQKKHTLDALSNVDCIQYPEENQLRRGKFQFIRMEYCSGGDLEETTRKSFPPVSVQRLRGKEHMKGQLSVDTVRSFLFQMCFSLYACREKLSLRHFDIKLLNFFVTDWASVVDGGICNRLYIGFKDFIFHIPAESPENSIVKLADFGTSAIGAAGLGDPVTIQQFTTLENTPPEFLLLGSWARQSFAADTFQLGLCFLHLVTGKEPYEELLRNVHCPIALALRIKSMWEPGAQGDEHNPFHVVKEVVESLDTDSYELPFGRPEYEAFGAELILIDTIYRFLVLFGCGSQFICLHRNNAMDLYEDSPVWAAIVEMLRLDTDNHNSLIVSLSSSSASKIPTLFEQSMSAEDVVYQQYRDDLMQWSLHGGSAHIMESARSRLHVLGEGAMDLLDRMVHFDPSRRCTMHDSLLHPVFKKLRVSNVAPDTGSWHTHYLLRRDSHSAYRDATQTKGLYPFDCLPIM